MTIQTIKLSEVNFKEGLKPIAEKLLDNGFRITISYYESGKKQTYLTCWLNNNPIYIQDDRLEGIKLSTVHKPSRDCGTGFGLIFDPKEDLIEQIKQKCSIAVPEGFIGKYTPVRYKDLEEYVNSATHKDCQFEVIGLNHEQQ